MTQTAHSLPASRMSVDRAAGVLLATACGDALGAGYEFDPPMGADAPVAMIGGGLGPFAPGEWTDDTSMAVAVAEAAAAGLDLRTAEGLDVIADGFLTGSRAARRTSGIRPAPCSPQPAPAAPLRRPGPPAPGTRPTRTPVPATVA